MKYRIVTEQTEIDCEDMANMIQLARAYHDAGVDHTVQVLDDDLNVLDKAVYMYS